MPAHPRVIGRERRRGRRHLTLVENINSGEPIVATARKKQSEALVVAEELGIDLETVEVPRRRTARKRTPNRNGPVSKRQFQWEDVSPAAQAHALAMAGGDQRRCKPINRDTVVILNHPQGPR